MHRSTFIDKLWLLFYCQKIEVQCSQQRCFSSENPHAVCINLGEVILYLNNNTFAMLTIYVPFQPLRCSKLGRLGQNVIVLLQHTQGFHQSKFHRRLLVGLLHMLSFHAGPIIEIAIVLEIYLNSISFCIIDCRRNVSKLKKKASNVFHLNTFHKFSNSTFQSYSVPLPHN